MLLFNILIIIFSMLLYYKYNICDGLSRWIKGQGLKLERSKMRLPGIFAGEIFFFYCLFLSFFLSLWDICRWDFLFCLIVCLFFGYLQVRFSCLFISLWDIWQDIFSSDTSELGIPLWTLPGVLYSPIMTSSSTTSGASDNLTNFLNLKISKTKK